MQNDQNRSYGLNMLFKLTALIIMLSFTFVSAYSYFAVFRGSINDREYVDVAKLYDIDNEQISSQGILSRFHPLLEKNSQTAGFVDISGTKISYPVMQSPESPNFYVSHDFNKNSSKYGAPYFSAENDIAIDNFNYVIYGNNTEDGRMFSALVEYKNADFYQNAPIVDMSTLYLSQRYLVFAVFIADQSVNCSKTEFYDNQEFLDYINEARYRSLIKTSAEVFETDSILTLICNSDEYDGARFVVLARRFRPFEEEETKYTAEASEEPLMPDKWYTLNGKPKPDYIPEFLTGSDTQSDIQESLTSDTSSLSESAEVSEDSTASEQESSGQKSQASSSKASSSKMTSSKESSSKTPSSSAVPQVPSSQMPSSQTSSSPPVSSETSSKPPLVPVGNISVKDQSTGVVKTGEAADIIAMVVQAELGGSKEKEALKAQTVAAYTFMIYNKADSGGTPSAPMRTATQFTKDAVNAVIGKTIKHNGSIISAYYFATSAGKTALAEDVWTNSLPYIKSVDSPVDSAVSGFSSSFKITSENLAKKFGVNIESVSDRSKLISVDSMDANNLYVNKITVQGKGQMKGNAFRTEINKNEAVNAQIRSHSFTYTYDKASDTFTFSVKGYGHGVGMSQNGADRYANQGKDYEWILKHYYYNVTVS